jgi:transposase
MDMGYKEGIDRNQYMLLPNRVEDYIEEESLPRLINVYVESLDMKELKFEKAEAKGTGRPPYNPKEMLKLYIYGLMNNIRSSRKLEKETYRNLEVMWLMRNLKSDHKSISEFRKNNTEGIKNVSKGFIKLCDRSGLIGGETIVIDGTKIKASNNIDKNNTEKKLEIMEERAEKKLMEYEKALSETEEKEEEEIKDIKGKIEEIKEKKGKYEEIRAEMKKEGEQQISLTDKDSRKMKTKDGKQMAYNNQIVVDSKNRLIIAFETTNEGNDRNQIKNMTEKAQEAIGERVEEVIADTGYMNGPEIKELEEDGISVYVAIPKPDEEKRGEAAGYTKDKFEYKKEEDIYVCPAGEELRYRHKKTDHGKKFGVYKCDKCNECKRKDKCTESKEGRLIHRWEHEEVIERMEKRVKENPEKMKQRKGVVEHVFGCIKHAYNQGNFLMRGKEKVSCEFAMSVLTHNLKRCISLLGIRNMMAMI